MSRNQHVTPHLVILTVFLTTVMLLAMAVLLALTRTSDDFGHLLFTEYDSAGDFEPFFYDWQSGSRQLLPAETVPDFIRAWTIDDALIFAESCFVAPYHTCNQSDFVIFPKDNLAKLNVLKPLLGKNAASDLLWSPDGRFVLFGENRDMQIASTDGSGVRDLIPGSAPDGYNLGWSPDSQHIAFTGQIGVVDRLDLTDYSVHQVINLGFPVTELAWSPDSRQLAIVAVVKQTSDASEIELVDTNGSNLIDIADAPLHYFSQLVWSPDSSRLALEAGGKIFVVNRNGTDFHQMTNVVADGALVWSPDSRELAFYGRAPSGKTYLYMMDTDGRNLPVRLIESNAYSNDTIFPSLYWLN